MWPGPSPPLVVLYCAAFWSWGALSYTAPIPPSFKSSRVLSLYPSEATVLPASLFGEDLCLLLEISVFNFLLLLSHHLHRPLHSLFFLRHRVPDAGLSVSYTTHLIQSPSNMLKVTGIQWQSLTPQTLALNHKFRATQPLDLPAQTSRQLSWPSLALAWACPCHVSRHPLMRPGWWFTETPCCQVQAQLGVKWEVTELGCEDALNREAGACGILDRATMLCYCCARALNFMVFNVIRSA